MTHRPSFLNAACAQYAMVADVETNRRSVATAVAKAAKAKADLLLLPELSHRLYFCQTEQRQNFDLAEPIDGPTLDHWSKLAKKSAVLIVGTLFEKSRSGAYFNTALVIEKDGSLAGIYRKMHIPQEPGYHEKYYFEPGDQGFKPVTTSLGKLGVLICWDQWFPEAARAMAHAGAELLLYPTAIGWDQTDNPAERQQITHAWINIQRGHAIANHLPVITSNRVGVELPTGKQDGIQFWGSSFILGGQGQTIAQGTQNTPEIITGLVDLSSSRKLREIWPFFRDLKTNYR